VHRDLKPANIMIGPDDEPTIMDFGIARSAGGPAIGTPLPRDIVPAELSRNATLLASQTMAGAIVGTVEYMAPEQAKGAEVDQRADIYAFGLILYDMLIGGRRSQRAASAIAELQARMEKAPPAPRTVKADIPPAIDSIITRCLEPDPEKRFKTTLDLQAALDRLDENGKPLPIYRRVSRTTLVAAAVMVLVLLGGTFYAAKWLTAPPKAHDPVSVVIADVKNNTGDRTFDNALPQTLRRALEDASFITAYDRSKISNLGAGVRAPEKFDEVAARELAVKQGLGVVLAGSIDPRGNGFEITVKALHTITGDVITTVKRAASSKDQVLETSTELAARVRKALGDETSQSAQLFAMRSISTSSLEVVGYYASGVEAQSKGRFEEARQSFLKAVEVDPTFGLAYQGLAAMSRNLGHMEDSEKYSKEALRYLDRMTERERFSARAFYYRTTGDNRECAKEYGELLARYPADAVAHSQRALCLVNLRQTREAFEEIRQAVQMVPNHVIYRINLVGLANLAGEFETAEAEVNAMQQPDSRALIALAYSQLARGMVPEATATYEKVVPMDPRIGALAAEGLADIRIYTGDFSAAARMFGDGATADLAAKKDDQAALKLTSKAYAHLAAGQKAEATAAADQALQHSKNWKVRFLAGRIFAEAGAPEKARPLATELASSQDVSGESQTHGKILEGLIALKSGKPQDAIKILTDANAILDTWFGHFDRGRAFLEAKSFVQADSEFDLCITRRGEALSLMDEGPTYGYFPVVYYYRGRVREELNTAGYAESYREYLAIRGGSKDDPLAREVRKRLGTS
jgi:tetratricopeptide (TPR) repeat protein